MVDPETKFMSAALFLVVAAAVGDEVDTEVTFVTLAAFPVADAWIAMVCDEVTFSKRMWCKLLAVG